MICEARIKNGYLDVCVSSLGAEIQSIKKQGVEYLWQGTPDIWERRAPVLFPFVGRLKEKSYIYNGRHYSMGQHGFARELIFQKLQNTNTSLQYRLSYTSETLVSYPFRFHLDIHYALVKSSIHITWKVSHEDEFPMYFSLGWHPALIQPAGPGGPKERWYIAFHTKEPVNYKKINRENLVEHKGYELKTQRGVMKIPSDLFDDDVLIADAGKIRKVSLLYPNHRPFVTVSFRAPLLGLWSPPGNLFFVRLLYGFVWEYGPYFFRTAGKN